MGSLTTSASAAFLARMACWMDDIGFLFDSGAVIDYCTPARLGFVRNQRAKERPKPSLDSGNVNKFINASVVAVTGMDIEFSEKLPRLFRHNPDART
jgi:3-hydroxypropanoate dehydrogenase